MLFEVCNPAGQFSSPYLGMGNNPVSRIDPDGGFSPPTDYVYTDEKGNTSSVHVDDGINQVIELKDRLQWVQAPAAARLHRVVIFNNDIKNFIIFYKKISKKPILKYFFV